MILVAALIVALLAALMAWVLPLGLSGYINQIMPQHGLALAVSLVGFAVGWYLSAPTVAMVVPLVSVIIVAERRRRKHESTTADVDRQLPLLIDGMVQRLRSGSGLHGVCVTPPTVGREVDAMATPMAEALASGAALAVAVGRFGVVDDAPSASEDNGSQLVATALTTVAIHGGPSAPALQRLGLTLTARAQARAESRARSSQALASARLLVAAPAVFAGLLAAFDGRLAHLYFREPVGAICVSACVALSYLGWRWMHHMVASLMPADSVGRGR